MANTFDSNLVQDVVTEEVVLVLQNRLAPLKAFSTDFSSEVIDTGRTRSLQVPIASSTDAVQTNPTNFELGDTTLGAAQVDIAHYSKGFGLTSAQMNQGHRLKRLVEINIHALADKLQAVLNAQITTTNFGAFAVTTDANFVSSGMPTLWAALKNGTKRVLVLDGSLYSKLLPTTKENFALGELGGYGWDGGIFMNNLWTGADANTKGFAASPEALAFAAALPYMDPAVEGLISNQTNIVIPDLGLTVQFNIWGSLQSRALRASFDIVFGAKAVETTTPALKRIGY